MDDFTRLLGAIVVTYFVRLLIIYVLAAYRQRLWQMVAANFVSATICALTAGFVKSAFMIFNQQATYVYFLAQSFWLLFDVWRSLYARVKVR